MKILLINPPKHERHEENIWKKLDACLPSLGLGYIASYLIEKHGQDVKLLDLFVERLSFNEIIQKIKSYNPDFIGITSSTVTIFGALSVAKISKEACPNAKIILGGAHPTAVPEEILKEPYVDFVVRGEGEIVFANLIKNYKTPEKVRGISYKSKRRIIHNPPGELIEDLDDLPYPAHYLLPMDKYKPAHGNYKRLPAMSVLCGRGCPGVCTFCYSKPFGRKIRFRSVGNIIGEIKLLIEKYGIREITFYDENFTTNRKLVQDLCKAMIRENIDITWICSSRVDTVDEKTLRLMARAGCHQIAYGIESGDEQILKNIKKYTSLDKARRAVRLTQKAGIDARSNFMFGCPGETKGTMQKTLDFAIKLKPDLALFNICTPLPGTEMLEWAKTNGFLMTEDYHDYDFSRHIMNLPTVSSKLVEEFYKKSHKWFYMRPSYLLRRIFKIRSLEDLRDHFQSLKLILQS